MLKRSADRKVTNLVSPNGKTAKIANSFGLPSGLNFSCPGATSVCAAVCYAGKLEKIYKGVANVLLNNWNALKDASIEEMTALLSEMIDAFRADCLKAEKRGNVVPRDFRIHWDGDFFSADYALAWRYVIEANRDINFWVYTRSFDNGTLNVLPVFDGMDNKDNLSLYLSVDRANLSVAKVARKEFTWAKWAFLSETFASGAEELSEAGAEGKRYNCPENGGRIALIDEKGSACIKCGICVEGRGDVVFAIKKR